MSIRVHSPTRGAGYVNLLGILCASAALVLLSACGGGGGGDDNVSPASPGTGLSISGTISFAARTDVDSDINDPNSSPVDNSSPSTAQRINNLGMVQGFATAVQTNLSGDNFESSSDVLDYYRVNLQAGQQINLQVVDYEDHDLDLFLLDSDQNLVDFSLETSEFELVQAPSSGEFFVVVEAFSGTSNYALQLSAPRVLQTAPPDFVPGEAIVSFVPSTSLAARNALGTRYNASNQQTSAPVLFRLPSVAARTAGTVADSEIAAANPDSAAKLATLREIKRLHLNPDVEYAEPNYRRHALAVPNDPGYPLQWHYPAIQLPQAWDISTGSDVIVAVIDTGVVGHPELVPNLLPGFDFISDPFNSGDGDSIDDNPTDVGDQIADGLASTWHGTHVSGTVAAATNNDLGVSGVAWDAKIMPLRVLGRRGGTSFDILEAVKFAAGLPNISGTVPARRADVINLSLGGVGFSQAEEQVYAQAANEGVIIVAAAGNANTPVLQYPASYDNVISVSAVDFQRGKAPYSSFGRGIDVAAPGGDLRADLNNDGYADGVLSTFVDEDSGTLTPSFSLLNGTSMATPHVAGVAALMKAVNPDLDSQSFEALLVAGELTDEAGDAGRDDVYGYGIINALKAVQTASSVAGGNGTPPTLAIVLATPTELAIDSSGSATLVLRNRSALLASVVSFDTSVPWLRAEAASVDANGMGQYRISVDSSSLSAGTYVGSVTFNFDSASSVVVGVSAEVGSVSTVGSLGPHYVLAVTEDLDTGNIVLAAQAQVTGVGDIPFQLSGLAAGDYVIIASTDVDNDYAICEDGEACGAYPTLADNEVITLSGSNLSGIDFQSDIQSSLNLFGQASSGEQPAERLLDRIQGIQLRKK